MSEKVRDILKEFESGGGELYWTAKQKRVLKAIVDNPDATQAEIASTVGCHQSYVKYVLENASPDVIRKLRKQIEAREKGEEAEAPAMLESFGGEEDEEFEAEKGEETPFEFDIDAIEPIEPFNDTGGLREDAVVKSIETVNGKTVLHIVQHIPVELTVSLPSQLDPKLLSDIEVEEGEEISAEQ